MPRIQRYFVLLSILLLCVPFASAGINRWTAPARFLPDGVTVSAIVIAPGTSGTIYIGSRGSGVYKSTDSGATWTRTSLGDVAVTDLALDPLNPSTVYASADGTSGGVYKSTNAGLSWTNMVTGIAAPLNVYSLAIDPVTASRLFIGKDQGFYKSENGAATWAETNSELVNIRDIAIDPITPTTIYAATFVGMFKTTDRGVNWNKVSDATNGDGIVVDPTLPTSVYVSTNASFSGVQAGGVLQTNDAGSSWHSHNQGLGSIQWASSIVADPSHPSTLYLGTNIGVYQSNAGGGWYLAAPGFNGAVYALAIDRSGRFLVAGVRQNVYTLSLDPTVRHRQRTIRRRG